MRGEVKQKYQYNYCMKTHYLVSGGENDDIFRSMMTFLDGLELSDKAQIYINSGGGSCWLYEAFIRRLNDMIDEWYNITLRILFVGSMAFELAYQFRWPRIVENRADGVVHIEATEVHVWRNKIRENDNTERKRMEYNNSIEQVVYPFLTEQEQREYEDWKDIYLNYDRMKKIFDKKV